MNETRNLISALLGLVALSAYADDRYVYGMLQARAAGYLLKEEALETVVKAIRLGWLDVSE